MTLEILHVVPQVSTRSGGPVAVVGSAARAMRDRGHRVRTLSTDLACAPGTGEQFRVTDAQIHPDIRGTSYSLFPTRFPRRLLYSPALARAASAEAASADLVHVHLVWLYPQFAAARAARRAGVPYVVSPHGALDPVLAHRGRTRKALTNLVWQRRMLEQAALIHVLTEEEGERIADIAPAVPRAVVPAPVDLQPFETLPGRQVFRDRFLDGYDGPVILFLGRITFKKRIDVLIDAFARVRSQLDCRLAVVGPDDERLTPTLESVAARTGVERDTFFIGPLYGPDRTAALAGADVWALPSMGENFGVAVVEAMAAGCPVVISSAVYIAEEVRAAGAGVITDQTPEGVAAGLRAVLDDPDARARMGAAAGELAQRYAIPAVAERLEQMYLRAVGHDTGRTSSSQPPVRTR